MDFWYPDLSPPYPTTALLQKSLSSESQLTPTERAALVQHSLNRACLFGDLSLLTFILRDSSAHVHVNLDIVDEDGLGLVSQTILGFGAESEKDLEREECIRMLISEGADTVQGDTAGWTPLHYATMLSPPTLVSYLLTHGSTPMALTRKNLTALDVINGYKIMPGREGVALLLEEAMRECGWQGTSLELKREETRRRREKRILMMRERREQWSAIGRVLDIGERWWLPAQLTQSDDDDLHEDENESDENEDDEVGDEFPSDDVYTPPKNYTNMLVFSLFSLPDVLQSVIANAQPVLHPISKRSAPANALYLLARFACIECDSSWLEALLVGAADRIEEAIYARPDDIAFLAFWLYNATLLLHFLRCDQDVNDMCEELAIHPLLEDVINAIYVFIIRVAEKRIDPLIDAALLDHSPLSSEFDSVQFESEWSFLRSLTPKKKIPPSSPLSAKQIVQATSPPNSPPAPSFIRPSSSIPTSRPPSPSPPSVPQSTGTKALNSLRSKFGSTSSVTPSSHPSINSVFRSPSPPSSSNAPIVPTSITSLLSSLHTLLTLYSINPALNIQAHSQILYWTACELFNRLLTRKKYLCRSKAVQIGMNLSVVEEWIGNVGLPRGVGAHFDCVRELLGWLQCLSSIDQFTSLVDTIQTMRTLNPLQMRRAVRDYRYEVNEGRMTEECSQYLAQLQKDWERRRVKLGVEAIRKEIGERQREREESVTSGMSGRPGSPGSTPNGSVSNRTEVETDRERQQERDEAQRQIDALFDRDQMKSGWTGPRAPEVLGELMDSRYMLPLALPSDPQLLCTRSGSGVAVPTKNSRKRDSVEMLGFDMGTRSGRSGSPASFASGSRSGAMEWRKRGEKVREVEAELVEWVDGGMRYKLGMGWMVMMKAELERDEQKELFPAQHEPPDIVLTNGNGRSTLEVDTFTMPPMSPGGLSPSGPNFPGIGWRRHSRIGRESSGGDTIVNYMAEEEG